MSVSSSKEQSIPWFQPTFWGEEQNYVMDSLSSSWISGGAYIERFENLLAHTLHSHEVLTVCNGTAALHLALLACDIAPGDEVIVPGFTFAAPANMAIAVGATPVFVDIDPNTWCISPESIKNAITPRTKAIIPVHLYGNVCKMSSIMKIAKENEIVVIEDTAEAIFSQYQNQMAGTFGQMGCFSFQATKTITTGEGGAVCSVHPELMQKAQIIRNHGMKKDKRYWHHAIGHNFRLTNFQAAMGLAQLEQMSIIVREKNRVYEQYRKLLKDIPGIQFQEIENEVSPVMWATVVKITPDAFKVSRDGLMDELAKQGIETRPGFYSFSDMPIYECGVLPHANEVSKTTIALPSSPSLSNDNIHYICETLCAFRK